MLALPTDLLEQIIATPGALGIRELGRLAQTAKEFGRCSPIPKNSAEQRRRCSTCMLVAQTQLFRHLDLRPRAHKRLSRLLAITRDSPTLRQALTSGASNSRRREEEAPEASQGRKFLEAQLVEESELERCRAVLDLMERRKDAIWFRVPVPPGVEDYLDFISTPCDYATVRSNLDNGECKGFLKHMRTIYTNAITYNPRVPSLGTRHVQGTRGYNWRTAHPLNKAGHKCLRAFENFARARGLVVTDPDNEEETEACTPQPRPTMAIFAAAEAEREQADRDGRRDLQRWQSEWGSSDEEEVLSSDGEYEYLDDEYMCKMPADYDYDHGYDYDE